MAINNIQKALTRLEEIANKGDVATIAGKELRTRVAVFSFGVDRKKDNTSLANLAKSKKLVTAW